MLRRKVAWALVVGGLVTAFAAGAAFAQNQGTERTRGNRGGEQFDPAQMRQRMQERMKESLGVTDEEWKVLQPKIDKIQTLLLQVRGGMMLGRRGGSSGATAAEATSDVEKASKALQTALDNKDTKAEEITPKLTALREAREKAKQELTKAQTALREIVTPRQEAQLVLLGILE